MTSGGLDRDLGQRIRTGLEGAEFVVRIHDNPNLQGVDKNNICNRGLSGQGAQLELSLWGCVGLRICKWLRGVDLNHRPLGYE